MIDQLTKYCHFRYPGGLAWVINVHKTTIRRVAEFKKLQNFLVYEAEVVRQSSSFTNDFSHPFVKGGISRQEAVSMIPPLILDVEPHHKVFKLGLPSSPTRLTHSRFLICALHQDPRYLDLDC